MNALDLTFGQEDLTQPDLRQPDLRQSPLSQQSWAFHRHLDVCAQCKNEPFNLCRSGYSLLTVAVAGVDEKEAA
jgi:hypothetical protein